MHPQDAYEMTLDWNARIEEMRYEFEEDCKKEYESMMLEFAYKEAEGKAMLDGWSFKDIDTVVEMYL